MPLVAPNRDVTLSALFAVSAVIVSEIENIMGFFSKTLAESPYVAIFDQLKPEACVVIAIALFSQSDFLRNFMADYPRTRLNWLGRRIPIGKQRNIFLEEGVFIVFVAIFFVVSTLFLVDRVRTSYSRYGLFYIARATCQGRFDLALARTEAIKDNPLWNRYEVELFESIPRLKYLQEQRPGALSAMQKSVNSASPVERLSLLAGAKAFFGVADAKRYIGSNVGSGSDPILDRWRSYLSEQCP